MKEYNWDELELKYFGPDYRTLMPQEKARMMLETIPLESEMERLAQEGASNLNNENATEVYRNLIFAAEGLPEFLMAFEEAKQKQRELCKKRESYKN